VASDIEKADQLIKDGKNELARDVLKEGLRKNPGKPIYYEDAVNIFMLGKMYTEAIETIRAYEIAFGRTFRGDFALEDIERERDELSRARKAQQQGSPRIFRRMSIRERGHFSNYFTLFPIREIEIHTDCLRLQRGSKSFSYPWRDVSARIESKVSYKAYGRSSAKFTQRLLVFTVRDKLFKCDVSNQFPDFKHSDLLLEELTKHIDIVE